MNAADPTSIAITSIYLAVVGAIAVWAARRTTTARAFFVADRSLGLLVTGLATATAAFSGFVFLGGPGLTYRLGAASFMICLPLSVTAALLGWTVAKRLHRIGDRGEVYTVPDVMAARFGRGARAWSAVAVVVGTVGYLGTQILALGILFDTMLDLDRFGPWSLPVATALGLAIVLAYAVTGGMLAGVYTDVLQGLVMVVAAVWVGWVAVSSTGSFGAMVDAIVGSDTFGPGFLDPLGSVPAATGLGFFFVFTFGVLGQPHMVHKLLMVRSFDELRWYPLVVSVTQSLCLVIWVGVGLAVPALVALGSVGGLERPDDATPAFLLAVGTPVLNGLVVAGVLAAIMSTADSFLNIGSAALVRDLPAVVGRSVRDELTAGRWAVIGLGVVACGVALVYGDLIALLGTVSFGTFAAALGPVLAVGLTWERVTARAATGSIAGGLGLNLGLELGTRLGWIRLPDGVLPSAVALAASFTLLFVVTAIDSRS